jgi:uncharacterized protein YeaO (DUF488 family)
LQVRYLEVLKELASEVDTLAALARSGVLTLVYGAADEEHNNAIVLRDVLVEQQEARPGT